MKLKWLLDPVPSMSVMQKYCVLPALVTFMLTSCATVGPDYHPPQINMPEQWTAVADTRASDTTILAEWWREFNDPVLDSLVADALAANFDLATAQAQLREARARRDLAGSERGPSVSVSGSGSRNKSSAESGSGATGNLYSAGFDASWEADVFGALRRGAEAAEADLHASVESLHDTQISLIAEVALNYIDLRTAENRLSKAEASLSSRKETYDLVSWRHQAGLVSALDVAQSRTELESVRASLPALHTAQTEAQNRLAALLGLTPGKLQQRLTTTATIPLASESVAVGIPADVLRQRPDVRAAERQLAAQTARLGEAMAARYPSFRLSGTFGVEALSVSSLGNSGAQTYSLLAGITAPIFDAGRIRSNIEIQDARVEQARLAYQAAVLTALEDVENALVAFRNTNERLNKLALATESAREALQIAEYQYAGGLSDFTSVLDSQRTLLDLEDQLASGSGELAIAQVQLYKALGGGWVSRSEKDFVKKGTPDE